MKNKEIKNKSDKKGSTLKGDIEWISISPQIQMSELVERFPELIEPLTYDYGLHCVNCMISEFDTLEEGAVIHGIEGDDFKDMIKDLENIVNGTSRE